MNKFDVAIIGGGAAGMMAAITASHAGKSVLLLEKNSELGRKVLATGNGRCNLTNRGAEKSRYYGANPEFIESILKSFDPKKVMEFFENLGVLLKEEDEARIFPRTNQASTIVSTLTYELVENKVKIVLGNQVQKINKDKLSDFNQHFNIILANGDEYESDKLIITTGGKSSDHLGTTGDGYFWAKNFGHTITPLFPALTPIETIETWPQEIQGLKVEGRITTTTDSKVIFEKDGDVLFTHFGLSGPAVMAHAGKVAPLLSARKVLIHIDLYPDLSIKNLNEKITQIFNSNGKKTVKNALLGLTPSNLILVILTILNIDKDKKTAEISKVEREKIVQYLKDIVLTVKSTRSFKESQVTSGGIDVNEVNIETLESKKVPGLYFAGEILDVDGDSGGFNLQWAWSSGHLAGQSSSN